MNKVVLAREMASKDKNEPSKHKIGVIVAATNASKKTMP